MYTYFVNANNEGLDESAHISMAISCTDTLYYYRIGPFSDNAGLSDNLGQFITRVWAQNSPFIVHSDVPRSLYALLLKFKFEF